MEKSISRVKTQDENLQEKTKFVSAFKDEIYVIKGLVQSGKTAMIIDLSILAYIDLGKALIILRNSDADLIQIYERINSRVKELFSNLKLSDEFKIPIIKKGNPERFGIHITLGNNTLEKYANELESKTFTMFIDEADYLDSGKNTKKKDGENVPTRTGWIQQLKEKAQGTFLISATVLDCLGKNKVLPKNIIFVPVQPTYHSFSFFEQHLIPEKSEYVGNVDGDLFKSDPDLLSFLEKYEKQEPILTNISNRPNMCLILQSLNKDPNYKAQEVVRKKFPTLRTIVYNGDGITSSYNGSEPKLENEVSIAAYLQSLKDADLFQNIVIFSGEVLGRGVSVVSTDYIWHSNYIRYLEPESRLVPETLQMVERACGNFKDRSSIHVFLTKKTLKKINRYTALQEECLLNLKKHVEHERVLEAGKFCKDIIAQIPIFNEKVVKNPTRDRGCIRFIKTSSKNIGMSMSVYNGKGLPSNEWYEMYNSKIPTEKEKVEFVKKHIKEPEQWNILEEKYVESEEDHIEFLRLCKIFKVWSNGDSKIARFMQHIDPKKTYTKDEIKKLCKEHGILILSHLTSRYNGAGSNGYGKILDKKNNTYKLYPQLLKAFEENF